MLELHHAGPSSCSQKVRLVLEAKELSYATHDVDLIGGGQHDPDYVKLNPNHVVPTLVDDGQVLIESTLINEYLEEAYPEIPLMPKEASGRHAVRLWTKKIDQLHPSAGVITYAIGPRQLIVNQPEEAREAHIAALPSPAAREIRRSVIEHGVNAKEFRGALHNFLATLDDIESTLAAQSGPAPWLSGEQFGLADAAAIPYVLRMEQLAMGPLIDPRKRVREWFGRCQALPCYAKAIDAYVPEAITAMFRANGESVWDDVARAAADV